MGKAKRVIIYARFSSSNQRDRSIEDQVRLCEGHTADDETVIEVLTDYAVSGSAMRDGFDKVLKRIEERAVDVIRTESADRLSRDLGDSDRLWKLCKFHGVRLHCVSDGIDSDNRGSRLQYGIKALIADEYIEDLRHKTLRGLSGQFERGLSTGGLPYGYRSEAVWGVSKKDPEGYRIEIDVEKAANVVRIFELYRDGHSLLAITETLNRDGIAPPRGNAPGKFWRKTTVREILRNEAYIGLWSFKKKKWVRDPKTRKRRYEKQSVDTVIKEQRPHLQIVPDELWAVVNERKRLVKETYKGRPGAPGRRTAHPFSGLLHCGACDSRMVDAGGKPRYYRCSLAMAGAGCENKLAVREDVLVSTTMRELKRSLFETNLATKMRAKIEAKRREFESQVGAETEVLTKEQRKLDVEIARVVTSLHTLELDDASKQVVADSLNAATRRRAEVEARLESLRTGMPDVVASVPTTEEIVALVEDIEGEFRTDPTRAREILRRGLVGGRLTLVPQTEDKMYRAQGAMFLRRLIPASAKEPRAAVPPGLSGTKESVGCGGRI